MVKPEVKERMIEYVSDQFKARNIPLSNQYVPLDNFGGLFLFGDRNQGALVLLYDAVSGAQAGNVKRELLSSKEKNRVLLLKDGKTFFRSGSRKNQFKSAFDLSLGHYSSAEIASTIMLSPTENLFSSGSQNTLHYYQPKSQMLEEDIVSYGFKPVRFEYPHIDAENLGKREEDKRFRPADRDSLRLFFPNKLENNTFFNSFR